MNSRRLACFLATAVFFGYLDRVNMSFALPLAAKQLSLSGSQQGLVLSMFSFGYVALMLPSGKLITSIGPKRTLAITSALWSLATLLSAATKDVTSLAASRFAVGAAEAALFPACSVIVAAQYPKGKRGRYTAIFESASYLASASCGPVMFVASEYWGWRAGFVFCAMLSAIWSISWTVEAHFYKMRGFVSEVVKLPDRRRFALSQQLVLASLVFLCYNFCKSFYISWLPTILLKSYGLNIKQIATVGTIPFIAAAASSLLGGLASDHLAKHCEDEVRARVLPITIGFSASTISFLLCIKLSPLLAIAVASLSLSCLISTSAPIWTLPGSLGDTPKGIAWSAAIMNTVSNIGGIIAPIIIGICYDQTSSFQLGAGVTSVVAALGAVLSLALLRVRSLDRNE